MATQKKTAEVDYSMQEKILALYDLQKIDSQIDSINKVKGELPLEVQDLDDELAGLKARVENINAEIEELNALSKQRKREVDQAKILACPYPDISFFLTDFHTAYHGGKSVLRGDLLEKVLFGF